ncbi:MAG: hypothetical protein GY862_03250 [Gammaproteobacteria bacterium]|nr:hypothetical protein [Gammaproteobacteria bacterium]
MQQPLKATEKPEMRLRYLHIRNYPPLEDVAIAFSAESPLRGECAIRFVAGVNGTGKTRVLQALAETFIALSNRRPPHFPVTLVYELGRDEQRRTLLFDNPCHKHNPGWWQSREILSPDFHDWENLLKQARKSNSQWEALIRGKNQWPGAGVGLPRTVLAYTTGFQKPWEALFHPEIFTENQEEVVIEFDRPVERPSGWTRQREYVLQHQDPEEFFPSLPEEETAEATLIQEGGLLITQQLLKYALVAVTLSLEKSDDADKLGPLLREVGWNAPLSLCLTMNFQRENRTPAHKRNLLPLFALATDVVSEPEPGTHRRLFFDLGEHPRTEGLAQEIKELSLPDEDSTAQALLEILGGPLPFAVFSRLFSLHRQGLLEDIQIALRKTDVKEVLLFDELSDGEQMFLGRIALFHLLRDMDDVLLLLDEPETHFNDVWKREIVAIIEHALKQQANDVVISTHSSIALTDVFDNEIIRLKKQDGKACVSPVTTTTFGADPSEIMIDVFDADDSIGVRSLAWLNAQLKREWTPDQKAELEKIIRQIGPGLHRSELRTIWRKLNAI